MKDRLPFLVFVLSLVVLAYAVGFATAFRVWPPAATFIEAYYAAENLWANWRNDLGFAPTRLLVRPKNPRPQPAEGAIAADNPAAPWVTVPNIAKAAEGYRLVSGLTPKKDSLFGVLLMDRSGSEAHFWPVDFARLSPDGPSPSNVFLHGIVPMRDGSIIVTFDQGDVIARVGPCGEVIWATHGYFHHGMGLSHDGTLWVWEDQPVPGVEGSNEHIVQIDPATGHRLRQISLNEDIIGQHALFGRFALRTHESPDSVIYCCDPFHPNDVDVLSPTLAPAFPMFEAGDLLVSLRALNMVAVIDPATAQVKWSQIGPWHQQHDPDFLPDGTISVYNNRMGLGASQIVAIDPATGRTRIDFEATTPGGFYSWRRGRHQTLPNGNIMIAESERGRAIEVDGEGQIVWKFENVYDAEWNGLVNDAMVLPLDFFDDGALACRGS